MRATFFFHADRHTDTTKLTVAFSNFANAPKTTSLAWARTSEQSAQFLKSYLVKMSCTMYVGGGPQILNFTKIFLLRVAVVQADGQTDGYSDANSIFFRLNRVIYFVHDCTHIRFIHERLPREVFFFLEGCGGEGGGLNVEFDPLCCSAFPPFFFHYSLPPV